MARVILPKAYSFNVSEHSSLGFPRCSDYLTILFSRIPRP
nr:MAG TPA: hypothetical protein [Caudoviricetes sp.]